MLYVTKSNRYHPIFGLRGIVGRRAAGGADEGQPGGGRVGRGAVGGRQRTLDEAESPAGGPVHDAD